MSKTTLPWMGRSNGIDSGDEPPHSADMYDALRDLFLGGPAEIDPATIPSAVERASSLDGEPELETAVYPRIEALILGHLPVLASAWVMQYARDAATQRGGPVALLRARAGEVTLELVGNALAASDPGSLQTLDEAAKTAARNARGLIVRVDETSEPQLADIEGIDSVTLLTGADEAAIVASYQTIKRLFKSDEESDGPDIRLAIMGSSPERAAEVAAKLERAAATFLHRSVSVSACVARIGAGRSTLLHKGPFDGDAASLIRRMRLAMAATPARTAPVQPAVQPVPVARTFEPEAHHAPQESPPNPLAPHVVSRLGHVQQEVTAAPRPAAPVEPPKAVSHPADSARPLASHIPQLSPTPLECPYEKGVEVAVDAQGRLQLLSHSESAAGNAAAVASLIKASSWARAHAALIQHASHGAAVRIHDAQRPVLRLLTTSVADHRELSEAGIRVHMLARVIVDGQQGWFSTEIG